METNTRSNQSRVGYFHQIVSDLPTTVGSRSTKIDRGTNFPASVSLKKVLNESSWISLEGLLILPFAKMPCSRQYSSQQALPIWTPACPMWTEIHSR